MDKILKLKKRNEKTASMERKKYQKSAFEMVQYSHGNENRRKKYCSFSRKFTSHASETIFQAEDLRSNNWMSNKLKDISNRLQ